MMMKNYDNSVEIYHIPNWPFTQDRHHRILIIGESESVKTNTLLNFNDQI